MEIKKVLIANRGEIACRIISTLKKLGKKSVAIYSDPDVSAEHVYAADEAIHIGGTSLAESYNNLDSILSACKKSGADAVHPGYGFMAENAEFARELEKIGIEFIGPSPNCIEIMGDKVCAKKAAQNCNITLVPGYIGDVENLKHAHLIANDIGFPVLIKAAAGGGGKGMRIVFVPEELEDAIASAKSEALNSFKDKRVFIEKYIQKPRHIEIQILADKHGNVVCLGERECSVQRRHQKVIEEAPSPFVDKDLRLKMYDQSIKLAKSVGYYSAGTIEYIADQQKNFYFMEMNTRIQVEHPVTELVTGVDIVEEMVRIAEGEVLTIKKNITTFKGWSFEARVYAENPANNFFPTTGFVTRCNFADNADRVESSIKEGIEVCPFYDPMVAKICVHDKNRLFAIKKMQRALANTAISGVINNLAFLESIFYNQDFISGNISTNFIQENYSSGFGFESINDEILYNFIAAAVFGYFLKCCRSSDQKSIITQKLAVCVNKAEYEIEAKFDCNELQFDFGNESFCITSDYQLSDILFCAVLNKKNFVCRIFYTSDAECIIEYKGVLAKCIVMLQDDFALYKLVSHNAKISVLSGEVKSSITGKLINIYVKSGDHVKKGDPLFIIEAMKMQNTFTAESSGVVSRIYVEKNSNVEEGQVIIKLETKAH